MQKKEYYEKNKDKIKIYAKSVYKCDSEKNKKYYEQEKETIKAQKKEHYAKNKDKKKNYYKKVAEKIKAYRKTIKAQTFTNKHKELKPYISQLKELEKIQYCPICGIKFEDNNRSTRQSFDHIVPGIQKIENIRVICYRCNSIKNNLTKEELYLLSQDEQETIKNEKPISNFNIDEKRLNQIYWYKKGRAKSNNIEFSLSKDDIFSMLTEFCPIFNIKLHYGGGIGSCKDNLFSIDRINPNLGYIPGNCRIISFKANRAKNNASKEEIKQIYNYIHSVLTGQLGEV